MYQIGSIIAERRRAKGMTQDELAAAVGVSGQAVSKWENGGNPDIELLPSIARFLGVSIDALFGLEAPGGETEPLEGVIRKLSGYDGNKMHYVHWLCECLLLCGLPKTPEEGYAMLARREKLKPGFFFLMPAVDDNANPFAEITDYQKLFATLGDEPTLRTLYFLDTCQGRQFTPQMLEKQLRLSPEEANRAIENLLSMGLLDRIQLEEDGVSLTIYTYARNEVLYAVLTLAAAFLKRGDLLIEEYGQISSRLQTPQD